MKKRIPLCLAVLLIFSMVLTACGSKDLTKGKNPQEIVLASGKAMQSIKTYGITMDMNMGMPNPESGEEMKITMNGKGSISVDPVKMHMTMDMSMSQTAAPMNMEIYAQVEDKKLIEYISDPTNKEQWMKMELPLDDNAMQMLNPASSLDMLKEIMVDAKVVGEEEENKVKLAVLEVTMKPEGLTKFMQLPGNAMPLQDLEKIFSSMGNITYKMWVRKDNLLAVKTEMDLGQMFKNMFNNQPDMPPEAKEMFAKITAVMSVKYVDFDQPVNITIPDNVKNSAQPIPGLPQSQS